MLQTQSKIVANGHKVSTPTSMSCSTVVSRDSVRMLLLVAASNDSDVLGSNFQNTFPSAGNLKKHHLIAGDEFGHEKDKVFIAGVRALHGLKSASAAFGSLMAEKLDEMNFVSSAADPLAMRRTRSSLQESGLCMDSNQQAQHLDLSWLRNWMK